MKLIIQPKRRIFLPRIFVRGLRCGKPRGSLVVPMGFFVAPASSFSASGGDNIYNDSGYRIHDFLNNDDFVISSGTKTIYWEITPGGGGGAEWPGGSGGIPITGSDVLGPGTYAVVIGARGIKGGSGVNATDGGTSSFNGHTATKVGKGQAFGTINGPNNADHNGGTGAAPSYVLGGGPAGAGGDGGNQDGTNAGTPGVGVSSIVPGATRKLGCAGGSGAYGAGKAASSHIETGGADGDGDAGASGTGTDPTDNTGNGGGGGQTGSTNGAKGRVTIWYAL